MYEAIKDANLQDRNYQKNPRVGLIVGSSLGSLKCYAQALQRKKNMCNIKLFNPYIAIQMMTSGISAVLSTLFKIYGVTCSVSAACSTSAHCIGHAFELIKSGHQDIIFAGGGEEVSLESACVFDAMRVLSSNFNEYPTKSSRVYDINRDGFVISGGAGIIVLESLNSALSRTANIYGEIIGYAATSDGFNMVTPSGDGAVRCMRLAKQYKNKSIDYINTHGTSTKIGDIVELNAIRTVFSDEKKPIISSTKSITGHALGASGVHEVIYTLLMLKNSFIAPSINIENLDPSAENINILQNKLDIRFTTAMSNSFGFGGVNTSLIIQKYE
jgi:3-oxoacyl-[acyl-carrier-protein] synthase-1